MPYIDTHAHLDQEEFAADRDAVLQSGHKAGVVAVICPGVSADSSRHCVTLAEKHAEIFAAVGIQPNSCADAADGDWQSIVDLAEHPRTVAIGETGLDRYWDYAPLDLQRDYFERHLRLSQQHDLPIIIHCRDAVDDLLPMLRAAVAREPLRGVLHAFSGDAAMADACLELGLHISFAGMVTYRNKKFHTLHEVARTIPDDRLLIETDSPYLMPHPLRGKQKRNEPAHVIHTAEFLGELRGTAPEQLAELTTVNARRLFRLP